MTAVRRLGPGDAEAMRAVNALFAEAFDDPDNYAAAPPGAAYLERLLEQPANIVLAAGEGQTVTGALVAYVLDKFEQERSEIYIYDLAVRADRRREGIATALIGEVQRIAAEIGAWVVYVQADHVDPPAVALYSKLGTREDVLHFDIPPAAPR